MPKNSSNINLQSNRNKFIAQGFFLAAAISIADTSTVLPLIVDYFKGNEVLVGVLSSLMKGGAIVMQLWTAFKAQERGNVLGSLRKVFIFRFLTWFSVGLSILFFAGFGNILVLLLISLFLFLFSFSAGVGVIYYQELLGKSFTKKYRGKAIAYKQIASGTAGIISGGISGLILEFFSEPVSFSLLFIISGVIMAFGFVIFWKFKETEKIETSIREKNFGLFLKNAGKVLKSDRNLQIQILSRFLSYALFLVFPFIILNAKDEPGISGKDIGIIISLQMAGAVAGNFLWAFLASKNINRCIIIISFMLSMIAISSIFFASNIYVYYAVYFIFGAAIDGFRLAFSNLILIIAPDEKRPVYIAVQNNLSSLGLFFAIPGGFILKYYSFDILSVMALLLLLAGLFLSFLLKKQ
ncbi:MAG: MFS transporter [Bacteroidales bacterium]|nr:MFS transporter [Bacteroidales bacterium]